MKVDSLKTYNINYQSEVENKKTTLKNTQIIGVISVGALGGAVLCGHFSVRSLQSALKKQGVELRNGIATIIENNQNYTGTIKRRMGKLGLKREIVKFEDGNLAEKTIRDIFGKELEGEFYKDGKLRIRVGQGKRYSMIKYDQDGNTEAIFECKKDNSSSKFEKARDYISKM